MSSAAPHPQAPHPQATNARAPNPQAESSPAQWLAFASEADRSAWLAGLRREELAYLPYHWGFHARPAQRWPAECWPTEHGAQDAPAAIAWRIWLILAGRGFGKTRAGAEWVRHIAESTPDARIALVAANLGEARSVMVEGESGLLALGKPALRPRYEPSLRRLSWPNGATAQLYSAGEPDALRGGQFSHGWCDEIAKWDQAGNRAVASWNNLLLGLRLGERPRLVATTTPRRVALVQRLLAEAADAHNAIHITRGTTMDNAQHLPPAFLESVTRSFGGSALGRQELLGELIEERAGALWSRALLERQRLATGTTPPLNRIVIGVDPPASAHGDACGIIVCGQTADGNAIVLADASVARPAPEVWARAVADAAKHWGADRVIAEANQGGAMVESVLRAAAIHLPLRLVHASRGKAARAEPVAALYAAGRVRHAAMFPALEDELCGLSPGGSYEGPGRSPDRADALVWALSELMLRPRAEPRVHQMFG